MITLLGKREQRSVSLVCGLWPICQGLFALPLGFMVCGHFVGEAGAGSLAFCGLWFLYSVLVSLLFLLASLVCNHLVGESGAGSSAFLWAVVCVLSVMDCLFFLFILLVGNHLVGEKGSRLLSFSLVSGLCTICHGLFARPLCVIGRWSPYWERESLLLCFSLVSLWFLYSLSWFVYSTSLRHW